MANHPNPQGQRQFGPTTVGGGKLFPRADRATNSATFDIVDQPVVFVASSLPPGLEVVFEVSADRIGWTQWRVLGQLVTLSADNPVHVISIPGAYRLSLMTRQTGLPWAGVLQPAVAAYPASTTQSAKMPLLSGVGGTGSTTALPILESGVAPNGDQRIRVVVGTYQSDWVVVNGKSVISQPPGPPPPPPPPPAIINPVLNVTVSPNGGNAPTIVTFDASTSTGLQAGRTLSVVFGDGSSVAPQSNLQVQHSYTTAGMRTWSLTLTNPDGGTSTVTGSFTIAAAATPPPPAPAPNYVAPGYVATGYFVA